MWVLGVVRSKQPLDPPGERQGGGEDKEGEGHEVQRIAPFAQTTRCLHGSRNTSLLQEHNSAVLRPLRCDADWVAPAMRLAGAWPARKDRSDRVVLAQVSTERAKRWWPQANR